MRLSRRPSFLHSKIAYKICSSMLAAMVMFACAPSVSRADSTSLEKLEARIKEMIRASGAETVGVAFYDLNDGSLLGIDDEKEFHAASTMKVPVMMEVFRQASEGHFSMDDRILIKNDFVSIADGSRYSISASSDSEPSLYKKVGQTETARNLVHLMITMSSNLATNILIEKVGAKNVMKLTRSIGARHIRVLRGVEDSKAYERGMNNMTTARDLMILLRHIAERRAVSPESSDEMIRIMLDQKFNEGIPARLPSNVKVAHKTGSITKISHDAAIVYPSGRKPYVLVILVRGIVEERHSHKLIADISRLIYESVVIGRS